MVEDAAIVDAVVGSKIERPVTKTTLPGKAMMMQAAMDNGRCCAMSWTSSNAVVIFLRGPNFRRRVRRIGVSALAVVVLREKCVEKMS